MDVRILHLVPCAMCDLGGCGTKMNRGVGKVLFLHRIAVRRKHYGKSKAW